MRPPTSAARCSTSRPGAEVSPSRARAAPSHCSSERERELYTQGRNLIAGLAPLVGEAPGLRNCWIAAGLNSQGIVYGPGIGRTLAHWIAGGHGPVDHTAFNVDRFADGSHNTPAFRRRHLFQRKPQLGPARLVRVAP
ncbi:4-methylaminobutanoate oxidase [Roseovarius sp. A-2]|nr:4-methylaminobutanoate oxidase [Roseovarius sp. A-2]